MQNQFEKVLSNADEPLRRQRKAEQSLFYKVQIKFREFCVLVFGPIPRGQNAEFDFAKKFCEFREFRVMDLAFKNPLVIA